MSVELTPWPGLREAMRETKNYLERELGHLHSELFDLRLPAPRNTLPAFASRTSQTIAKIDREVSMLRSEVDERLAALGARAEVLEARVRALAATKDSLEALPSVRPVSPLAATSIAAIVALVAGVASRVGLDLSAVRALIIALLVVAAGLGSAYGSHSLGLGGRGFRWGGLAASIGIAVCGGLIIEAGAGDGPGWRRAALVALTAAISATIFAAAYGFIATAGERRRRRLLADAMNGIAASKNELTHVLPAERKLLKAAQVALGELASNNCRIARENFITRAAQLVEEAEPSKRRSLEREVQELQKDIDGKVQIHLESPGQPDAWAVSAAS